MNKKEVNQYLESQKLPRLEGWNNTRPASRYERYMLELYDIQLYLVLKDDMFESMLITAVHQQYEIIVYVLEGFREKWRNYIQAKIDHLEELKEL